MIRSPLLDLLSLSQATAPAPHLSAISLILHANSAAATAVLTAFIATVQNVYGYKKAFLCPQGDEVEDLPGEQVSEEHFTDEHGNIVTKKVSHLNCVLEHECLCFHFFVMFYHHNSFTDLFTERLLN